MECVCFYVCVSVWVYGGYRLITGEMRKVLCVSPGSELSWVLVTLSICSLAPNQGQMEPQRLTWLHPQLQLFITAIFFALFFPLSALTRTLHFNALWVKNVIFIVLLVNVLFIVRFMAIPLSNEEENLEHG